MGCFCASNFGLSLFLIFFFSWCSFRRCPFPFLSLSFFLFTSLFLSSFSSSMIAWSVFHPLSTSRATTHSCPHSSLRKNSVRNIIKGQVRHLFLNPLARWNKAAKRTGLVKCVCVRKRQWHGDVFVFTPGACVFSVFSCGHESRIILTLCHQHYTTQPPPSHTTWNTNVWIQKKKKLTLISHISNSTACQHITYSPFLFLALAFCPIPYVSLAHSRKIPRYYVTLFRLPALTGIYYININAGQQHTKTNRHAHIFDYTQ